MERIASGSKKALLIGVYEYEQRRDDDFSLLFEEDLDFCNQNVKGLYDTLISAGFEIPPEYNLTGRIETDKMANRIKSFFKESNSPHDILLFYYCGYVYESSGIYYLKGSDRYTTVSYDTSSFINDVKKSKTKRLLLLIDSFSDWFGLYAIDGLTGLKEDSRDGEASEEQA
jgi:hypothetical protein